ncbi:MAG: hypothetical protein JWO56_349 [Acidobacteria bacterium]|nr:hypothetical protein [Acidobacteriota bacterium]
MKSAENLLPRLIAAVVLLVSLAMFIPLVHAARTLFREGRAPAPLWLAPLMLLATGALLTHVLTRRLIPTRLVISAFALWIVTAGYFFVRFAL